MQEAAIEFTEDGLARVSGEVTIHSATSLYREWIERSRHRGLPAVVDLERVNQIDSAGLALLLEWQSAASRDESGGSALRILNPPSALRRIARLCDAEPYLNLDQKGESAQAT